MLVFQDTKYVDKCVSMQWQHHEHYPLEHVTHGQLSHSSYSTHRFPLNRCIFSILNPDDICIQLYCCI